MKIASLALASSALLLGVSAAHAFTPPQDADAPAQVILPAPQVAPAQQSNVARTQETGKTRAQVERELAEAKANGQYTFGELDYPPKAPRSH